MSNITREEWDKLSPDQQFEYYYWRDFACEHYEHVMQEIPECPEHGHLCTAHAVDWVRSVVQAKAAVSEFAIGELVTRRSTVTVDRVISADYYRVTLPDGSGANIHRSELEHVK